MGMISYCFLDAKKGVGRNSDRTRKRIATRLDLKEPVFTNSPVGIQIGLERGLFRMRILDFRFRNEK